jgi:hypothetical protein
MTIHAATATAATINESPVLSRVMMAMDSVGSANSVISAIQYRWERCFDFLERINDAAGGLD